jgi:hypothetical protein
MKFYIQHNKLEQQHNSLGEWGQGILLGNPFLSDFLELSASYYSVTELKMILLDAESNSAPSTTH